MPRVVSFLTALGDVGVLTGQVFLSIFRKRPAGQPLWDQMDRAGVGSWPIATLSALSRGRWRWGCGCGGGAGPAGAVLALQFATGLQPYGGSLYTGKLVALGIIRELGPTLTAVLVGGRVGAGFTAEIGSMTVTEQVDAIQALGADPVEKLVVPRVLACVIMLPLLTLLADFVGCFGGMLATVSEVGVTPRFYVSQIRDTITVVDLFHGLFKSVFFGYFIAIIGCYMGLRTRGGTEGVGKSTTDSVVAISLSVLIGNFFLTKLFLLVYG
jgi:phospholipid/cholesterol/gamma-HCH transport system permease protein